MKYVGYVLLAVLVLLSVATGVTKLVQLPAEMDLFRNAGYSDSATVIFGLFQVAGGLALVVPALRKFGAGVTIVTFALASAAVWTAGMVPFFIVSLAFIALATLPFWPDMKLPGDGKD